MMRPLTSRLLKQIFVLVTIVLFSSLYSQAHARPDYVTVEAESGVLDWDESLNIPANELPQVYQDSAASGGAGVAWFDKPGNSVSLTNAPFARSITVRYATQLTGEISIYVNGEDVASLSFDAGLFWTGEYLEASVDVNVKDGDTFTIRHDAGDTALNIDSVRFNKKRLWQINDVIYEAELATLFWDTSLGIPDSELPQIYVDEAASGGKGIAWFDKVGNGFTFKRVPESKSVTIVYATQLTGKISLYIDGVDSGDIEFDAGPFWTGVYQQASLNIDIPKGSEVTIQHDAGDTALNFDYVQFNKAIVVPTPTPEPTPVGEIVEAESGILFWDDTLGIPPGELPQIYLDDAASGGQGVAWLDKVGNGFTLLDVPAAQSVTVRYASQLSGTISLYVNGFDATDLLFADGPAWTGTYIEASANLLIDAGDSFTIQNDEGDLAMNVDYVKFNEEPVDIIPTPTPTPEPINDGRNKFEPEGNQVLMLIGQDNEGVGGNSQVSEPFTDWDNGYLDVGLPRTAGVTTYISLRDESGDPTANVPDGFTLAALHNTGTEGAGPLCLKCYLDNSDFDTNNTIMHLSIAFADDAMHPARVANGELDVQIAELADFLLDYQHVPFFVRPGYEFDLQYRDIGVTPEEYIAAYRRIIDGLRNAGVDNFAAVFSSGDPFTNITSWFDYYPGEDYVDWIGYSHFLFLTPFDEAGVFQFAESRDKPIMIAEAAPRGSAITEENGQEIWDTFISRVFATVDVLPDHVKAIAYINTDWRVHPLWQELGLDDFAATDSRIQQSTVIFNNWVDELNDGRYIMADDDVFGTIQFTPPTP